MLILYFPYGTDAPLYHRPIITIVMIVINYIVYVMFAASPFGAINVEQAAPYVLSLGAGLHPFQWLTSNFVHANFFHYLFNMFFLWVFGLVIEGKLGALKMSAVYLGIGILQCAAEQSMMLGRDEPTYSLGASSIIFGLAVMSLIWAPRNEIYGHLYVFFFPIFRCKHLETKISTFVCLVVALEVIVFCLIGGLSSALLHLMGAAIGLVLGITMLFTKLVDCEDWDIFSVWSGRNTMSDEERAKIEENDPKAIKRRAEKRQKRQNLLTEEIESAIQNQMPLPAFIIAQRTEREFSDWILPQDLHLKMIQQLLAGKHWTEAIMSMRQYLDRHEEQLVFVRVMLAQTLLTQNKPKAAMKVLDDIVPKELTPEKQSAVPKIRRKAEAMHQKNLDEGVYELDM